MQRRPVRWSTRFGSFVTRYTVDALTRDLAAAGFPVSNKAVYSWLSGHRTPRLDAAQAITRISRGAVTIDDLCRHRQEVGDGQFVEVPPPARRARR